MGTDGREICLIQAQFLCQFGTELAAELTCLIHLSEDVSGQLQFVNGLPVPILFGGIVDHASGHVSVLGFFLAGEEITQQIRH